MKMGREKYSCLSNHKHAFWPLWLLRQLLCPERRKGPVCQGGHSLQTARAHTHRGRTAHSVGERGNARRMGGFVNLFGECGLSVGWVLRRGSCKSFEMWWPGR